MTSSQTSLWPGGGVLGLVSLDRMVLGGHGLDTGPSGVVEGAPQRESEVLRDILGRLK